MRAVPPTLPRTPTAIRAWRRELPVSQVRLARELGITSRSITAYETGATPIPPLLPWALVGLTKPLRSKLRQEAHRARANKAMRKKRQAERARRERLEADRRRAREYSRALRREIELLGRIFRRDGWGTPEEAAKLQELESILKKGQPPA